jgi:3-oxoadipate enol-lactonase
MPYADAGIRLWYERSGRGEPLLWLTGFGTSGAILQPAVARFANHVESVIFDPPGTGRSSAPLRPALMSQFAADAVGLLDALAIPAAHVYGISWGALVAQELAIRHPDRVRALILGGAPVVGLKAPPPGPARLAATAMLLGGLFCGWTVRDTRLLERVVFSRRFRREHPDEVRRLLLLLTAHRPTPRGLAWQQAATLVQDTASRLGGIGAPTLVLRGERDALVPAAHADMLVRHIPVAELAELPGAGHLYLHECPNESTQIVRDWLGRGG